MIERVLASPSAGEDALGLGCSQCLLNLLHVLSFPLGGVDGVFSTSSDAFLLLALHLLHLGDEALNLFGALRCDHLSALV